MEIRKNLITLAVMAAGLVFSAHVMADDVSSDAKKQSKAEYKAAVDKAEADYKAAKAHCKELKGNDKDVCMKEAKAAEKKAKADAKANKTSEKASAGAGADKREAEYKVAKEKCDAMSGNAKDTCVAEAKAKYHQ